MMRSTVLLSVLSLLIALQAAAVQPPVRPDTNDLILRAPRGQIGEIIGRNGLEEIRRLSSGPSESDVALARAPEGTVLEEVVADLTELEPALRGIEIASLAMIPETQSDFTVNQSTIAILSMIDDPSDAEFGNGRVFWQGYVEQAAVVPLRVNLAQKNFQGTGVVAVIDTGIDPDHPLFENRLVDGYDFIKDLPGIPSDWDEVLDPSAAAVLSQSTTTINGDEDVVELNQSTIAILSPAQASELDPTMLPPAFGHGTMVAGIVLRVAPDALIMPLRAFHGNGLGNVFDVIQAIYYAVDNGATVINMSFSLAGVSEELLRAINYAELKGATCVASAGNQGLDTIVYPAGLGNTIGVASTDAYDYLSEFSNRGTTLVTIAAPGEYVVTAYPGGGWAVGAGTSYAAPWITGVIPLFVDSLAEPHPIGYYLAVDALSHADAVNDAGYLAGYGRADLKKAMAHFRGD